MGILKRARATAALSRKGEELLYEQALDEFESGEIRRGLWAQALAEGQGDESRAKGLYMKLRVRSMIDEGAIVDQLADTAGIASGASLSQVASPPRSPSPEIQPLSAEQAERVGQFERRVLIAVVVLILAVCVTAAFVSLFS